MNQRCINAVRVSVYDEIGFYAEKGFMNAAMKTGVYTHVRGKKK